MMDLSQWFSMQLNAGAEGFLWAVEQVPAERRLVTPPTGLGQWNVPRHAFHIAYYEQTVVLPTMQLWVGEPRSLTEIELDDDTAWDEGKPLESIMQDFRAVRAEQILLLQMYIEEAWEETRSAVWGDVTLKWVVTKTYQHTCEHIHDVLRLALFWDGYQRRQEQQAK